MTKAILTVEEEAELLIKTFTEGLRMGVKHYRKSDNKLLLTVKEILEALRNEKQIDVEFPQVKMEVGKP